MDIDLIEKMKVEELKSYLRLRGLKVTGNKKALIARVFIAAENNVQPVLSAVEVEEQLRDEHSDKLKIDGLQIPDPNKIPHGWMKESEGIIFWPMLLYPDIFHWLMFFPSELGSEDLSDYKNCKAYSYFKNGWLGELEYPNLSGSKFCILKGDCRMSQNIKSPFHKLWVIIEKGNSKIRACHCECMNGMVQTCNHAAAALFRVEAAVRNGLTNPSCTSAPNKWLPTRGEVLPSKVKDIVFNRDDFAQRGKKKRPLCSVYSKESIQSIAKQQNKTARYHRCYQRIHRVRYYR